MDIRKVAMRIAGIDPASVSKEQFMEAFARADLAKVYADTQIAVGSLDGPSGGENLWGSFRNAIGLGGLPEGPLFPDDEDYEEEDDDRDEAFEREWALKVLSSLGLA